MLVYVRTTFQAYSWPEAGPEVTPDGRHTPTMSVTVVGWSIFDAFTGLSRTSFCSVTVHLCESKTNCRGLQINSRHLKYLTAEPGEKNNRFLRSLDMNSMGTLLLLGFIMIMCVYLTLSSFCIFCFCLPFFST